MSDRSAAPAEPPAASPRPQCEHEHDCECQCGDPIACAEQARFSVRRGDKSPGFIPFDACETHVAEAMALMAEGSDVPIIVRIYWDGPVVVAGGGATEADRLAAEGITGLYWDNLGHGGGT